MVADTQLHKLSLIIFDFSTYKRTNTNFRHGEKPSTSVPTSGPLQTFDPSKNPIIIASMIF